MWSSAPGGGCPHRAGGGTGRHASWGGSWGGSGGRWLVETGREGLLGGAGPVLLSPRPPDVSLHLVVSGPFQTVVCANSRLPSVVCFTRTWSKNRNFGKWQTGKVTGGPASEKTCHQRLHVRGLGDSFLLNRVPRRGPRACTGRRGPQLGAGGTPGFPGLLTSRVHSQWGVGPQGLL